MITTNALSLIQFAEADDNIQEDGDFRNGGSSCRSDEAFGDLSDITTECLNDCLLVAGQDIDGVEAGEKNTILLQKGLGPHLPIASQPDDWVPHAPKTDRGEPQFDSLDNLGGWSQYT